ncbi:MAG: hypothetical protein WBD20_14890 [Pirellulaceae bacterium]
MRTSQVVVIDEDPKDAMPLLTALGRAGIGAVYVKGDEQACLPESPCTGVRLVFLDLKLLGTTEPANYIPHTVQVLLQSVRVDPGVTGIVCWTKHTEDVELLVEELKKAEISPAFVHAFPNKLAFTKQEDASPISEILSEVEKLTADAHGRKILSAWEQASHDSMSEATRQLWELGNDDKSLVKLLAAIGFAVADERIATEEDVSNALIAGMSAFQVDAIERLETLNIPVDSQKLLLTQVKKLRQEPLGREERSELNRVLITTRGLGCLPGCLYAPWTWSDPEEFPCPTDGKMIRGLIKEYFPSEQNDKDFIEGIEAVSTVCFLKLTPPCDVAQGKSPFARLVPGLLINSDGTALVETSTRLPAASRIFAKDTPFFRLVNADAKIDGSYKLIVNARRMFTIPHVALAKQQAVCRLRQQLTADFTAWLSAHGGRPGFVAVY